MTKEKCWICHRWNEVVARDDLTVRGQPVTEETISADVLARPLVVTTILDAEENPYDVKVCPTCKAIIKEIALNG